MIHCSVCSRVGILNFIATFTLFLIKVCCVVMMMMMVMMIDLIKIARY